MANTDPKFVYDNQNNMVKEVDFPDVLSIDCLSDNHYFVVFNGEQPYDCGT